MNVLPKNLHKIDSQVLAKSYIQDWAINKLLLEKSINKLRSRNFFASVVPNVTTGSTSQFKVLNITMPEIRTAGINQLDEQIVIAIDEIGEKFYNGMPVSIEQLNESLVTASEMKADFSVLIMADEGTELKKITEVMDLCRNNQFNQIRLQSR